MPLPILTRRRLAVLTPAMLLAACAADPAPSPLPTAAPAPAETPTGPGAPSGRVQITQTQASFVGNVAWGSGTLYFENRRIPFRINGLGVGGFGVSRMTATGEVYGLRNLSDFPGVYGQLRAGLVAGDAQLRGGLWMQNSSGVRINLRPQREGLSLQLGGDGMYVELR
jgi:hypothetical protein